MTWLARMGSVAMVVFGLCLLLSIKLSHSTDEIEKQQTTITEAVGDVDSNWTLYKEPYLRRSKRTPVPWEDAGMPSAAPKERNMTRAVANTSLERNSERLVPPSPRTFPPPLKEMELPVKYSNCSRSASERRVLIHLGRCGGNTAREVVKFDLEVHVPRRHYDPKVRGIDYYKPSSNDHLYILVRDPVERLISAWYHHHGSKQLSRQYCSKCVLQDCYRMFRSPDDLGRKLPWNSVARTFVTEGCIHHWKENYYFFIRRIASFIISNPCKVDLLRQEHLPEDLHRLFQAEPSQVERRNRRMPHKPVSKAAKENLGHYLKDEYEIYHWLLSIKSLDP